MTPMEGFSIVKIVWDMVSSMGATARRRLVSPMITVGLLLFLYGGQNVIREGSISAGIHAAFFESYQDKATRDAAVRSVELQQELKRTADNDIIITHALQSALDKTPNAARVRLVVFHNGAYTLNGGGLLRFDVLNSVAAPGRAPAELSQNTPLSQWNGFLPTLLKGECVYLNAKDDASLSARARMALLNIKSFLICPVIDVQGRVLGAISTSWEIEDVNPSDELVALHKGVAAQIAVALDLRK